MQTVLLVLHIILAFSLIALILLQHGRGADTGAAFGSGASNTVFGARGSASFLSRTTGVLAVLFFANSLVLANLSARQGDEPSLMERVQQTGPGAAGTPAQGDQGAREGQGAPADDLPDIPTEP